MQEIPISLRAKGDIPNFHVFGGYKSNPCIDRSEMWRIEETCGWLRLSDSTFIGEAVWV